MTLSWCVKLTSVAFFFFKLDKHFCFFKKSPVTSAAIATPGYYFSCKSILYFCSAAVSKTKLVIVLVLT